MKCTDCHDPESTAQCCTCHGTGEFQDEVDASNPFGSGRTLREVEMDYVLTILGKHNGNKPAAASELGISLKTLYNKLNQLRKRKTM